MPNAGARRGRSSLPSSAALLLLLAWLSASAGACMAGKVPVAETLARTDEQTLRDRARLGPVGRYGEGDSAGADQPSGDRARDAAVLALELGNFDEAGDFAREQLALARGRALVARMRGRDEQPALAALDGAAAFAVEIGDAIHDGPLVLESAQFLAKPKRARKALTRALSWTREADISWGYARLWEVFARHPQQLAALQRLRWRGHRAEGLPIGAPRLSPEQLAKAGAAGLDLLWAEADRAAFEQRREDYGRWIDAILEVDRWDPDAAAARLVLDALASGALEQDPMLLPDLATSTSDPLGAQARWLLREQGQQPSQRHAHAARLQRAALMVRSRSFGDAAELLSAPAKNPSKAERALVDTLWAMIELETGTEAGRKSFEKWRRRTRADRSNNLAEWLSTFEQEHAPASHLRAAQDADRRLVDADHGRARPRVSLGSLGSAAVDRNTRRRTRERALAGVAGYDPKLGAKLAVCRERKLVDDDCRDLVDELGKLDYAGPEYGSGLDALDQAANTRSSWLSPVPWLDAEQLPQIRERVRSFEGTRVAATTDYQTAALFSELAANRPDLAQARLDAYAAMLRPETQVIAQMALLDLHDGLVEPALLPALLLEVPGADVDAAWFLERWLPGDPAMVAELFPGQSRLARFARGLALARMGAWHQASAELLLTMEELDGAGKGMVAGRLALAAQLAGETVLRDRALAIADAEDPGSFMAPYVRARMAEGADQQQTAHELYLQALLRRPQAEPALAGAMRTLPLAQRELGRVRDALLLFPDRGLHWWASELLDAAHPDAAHPDARDTQPDPEHPAAALDGPMLTALWLASEDGDAALALGEPAARLRPSAEAGLTRLLEALENQPTPDSAFPIAGKVLAWLGAMPSELRAQHRDLELWLTFLVGRDAELEALAAARPMVEGRPRPPMLNHGALALAAARRAGSVDDLMAWALVRAELWDSQDPLTAIYTASLYAPIEEPNLAQYACLVLFQHDEFERGAERCVPLWNQLKPAGGSPFLAVDLAYLVLNKPELALGNGLELEDFFSTAATLPALAEDPVWLLNASLWNSKQGRHEIGAGLRVRQLALDAFAGEPDDLELGQARYRGALLRQQVLDEFELEDRRRWALAAGLALRSLDLIAAQRYGQRLLAWLPPPEADSEAPALTSEAPQALAAARLEGDTSDAELRSLGLYTLGMTAMVDDDLRSGRADREALLTMMDDFAEDRGLGAYEAVAAAHPQSHVAKLLILGELREARVRERATALARELVALHPREPIVLAEALPLLTGPEDLQHARELLLAARDAHPHHPWLSDEAMPGVLTGAEDSVPPWMRDGDDFGRQLAAIDSETLAALQPRRLASTQVSAEAFFAASAQANGGDKLGVHEPIPGFVPERDSDNPDADDFSRVQFVVREPRASRCEGLGCAEPLIGEWINRGYTLLWTRELELPAGPAVEFLVADGESIIDNVLVPTGGNLFILLSGTTPADFEAFLPEVALLHDSFRPLDLVLAADGAEAMRSAGERPPADLLRWQARRAMSEDAALAEPRRCALERDADVGPQWQTLTPAQRGELLLDLFLASRSPGQRRALLACVAPSDAAAARLALLALLDGHAAVYEWGRAATTLHPTRVIDDARRLLYEPREPAVSDPRLTLAGDQPAFGLLQVIAALPDAEAQAFTRELLGRRDPRLRAIALAASATMDYFGDGSSPATAPRESRTDAATLREVVRKGEPKDALLAVRSVMDIPGKDNLAALRERADALIASGAADEGSRTLAHALAWALGQQLESGDRKRLAKLAAAIDQAPSDGKTQRAEQIRESIEALIEDFDEARKLLSRKAAVSNGETAQRWVRQLRPRPAPRSREQLAKTPLAELIPGHEWTFVRVGNAGLFATSLQGLLRRLTPANAADAYLVRTLIHDMVLSRSFSIFADGGGDGADGGGGGLDLSAPIECASPKGSETFVCSATVRDREQLLATLAEREQGDDAGVAVPLSVATEFAGLPLSLGALPMVLHSIVEASEDELQSDQSAEISAERLRATRMIAGHALEYYATVEIREHRLVVDSEHYLIIGDRLLVFSGSDVAEQLLREPGKGVATLATQPPFVRATASWRDGVAMQAVDFTGEQGLPELALELVLDNEGLEFLATGTAEKVGSTGNLAALLPPDPVSHIALALEPGSLAEAFEDSALDRCADHGLLGVTKDKDSGGGSGETCGLLAEDKLPPLVLAEAAQAMVLGWYPAPGDALWQPWVLLMPLDADLRKAAAKAGVTLPKAGELKSAHGLVWQVRDGALAVASNEALAAAVRDQPAPAALPKGAPLPFAHAGLDGTRAAAVVRAMAGRYDGDRRADYLRLLATMIGLVENVELDGEWTEGPGQGGRLRARVRLHLAESEEELALIDRWLASPEIGNASKLPRRVSSSDTAGGLIYRIAVDDAEQFARTAIPDDNPRMRVEVLGANELQLTVLPSSAVPAGTRAPLSEAERARMLGEDELMRTSASAIVTTAKQLKVAGDDAATVAAVVTWVHEHVKYEVTPNSPDALTILESGQGDCTEYALLTVTILRAAGIPAQLQEGMAAGGDEMVAHAWVAWHDGQRWREVDPTAGTDSVGAGHLELEVVDVLAMISLGRFEVVEVRGLR